MDEKKRHTRDLYLRRKYGISIEQYEKKLADQFGCCDICLKPKEHFKMALAVDHNHATGRVRGLLCYACNKFKVGRNNLDSATKLYQYMLKHEG